MDSVIKQMLSAHTDVGPGARKNVLKEIAQEIVLCGLSRAGFFNEAAFYGGTVLRIFHGLDRFSEDLDFSLTKPNPDFDLNDYLPTVEKEVKSLGLNFVAEEKQKTKDSNIKSAFLKGNTKEHFLLFYPDEVGIEGIMPNETIKIKLEVDVNPPSGATFEKKYRLLPFPYEVALYDMPSLFAGKLHAVVCRAWKDRVKGRDLYDFIFYLQHNTPVNLEHLRHRLLQSGYQLTNAEFTSDDVKKILKERFAQIDFTGARQDAEPFVKDIRVLNLWGKEFFTSITDNLTGV